MAGTKEGGKKAALTNKLRHGDSFYANIGAKGGSACVYSKGFGSNRELARKVGAIGGHNSHRGEAKK